MKRRRRLTAAQKRKRAYLRAYCAERYRRRRRVAVRFLAMLHDCDGCRKCGGPGPFVIDHVDPSTKTLHPSQLVTCALRRLWRELRTCQLLCHDCNAEKSLVENVEWHRAYWRRRRGEPDAPPPF